MRAICAGIGAGRIAIALGLAGVAAGIALSWAWLTAIGVAPVLVAAAPCAAMCALGLCMPAPRQPQGPKAILDGSKVQPATQRRET
jgi:hypothetical protein